MQEIFTITHFIDGIGDHEFEPKQNPIACLVGIAEDLFKQPYYLVEIDKRTVNLGSSKDLNHFINHNQSFQNITVKDAFSPLGDENHLILNRNIH
ncbi:hypothetical protein [Thiomicrorhabdus sp.]|uniref:hypothetical protein n=1 Tax=Thiomicrorhabdus sp. TaxID=2039724 RepID=UPI003563904B